MGTIGIIGCGNMGGAFARHFAKKHTVLLYDKDPKKTALLHRETKAQVVDNVSTLAKKADTIVLGIKPKDLPLLAKELPSLEKKRVISMLAGLSLSLLRRHLPKALVIRVMPNLALLCGQGAVAITEDGLKDKEKEALDALFHGMGLVLFLPENKIEAFAALTSSGLGFVFALVEGMMDGGVYLGFAPDQARELVLTTFQGAISLLKETGKHPAELKSQITSPGGTTIAGLRVLEQSGVRSGLMETLIACYNRGLLMEKEVQNAS